MKNKFFKALGFDPVAKQTSIRTEIVAGIVTFLAMAYILTVNPAQILVSLAFCVHCNRPRCYYWHTPNGVPCKNASCASFRHGSELSAWRSCCSLGS